MRLLAAVLGGFGLIVAAPACGQPSSVAQQFEAANEAYDRCRYGTAVEAYRAVLDAGHESAALYHNLGNAYVRLDRTGLAVWAYERGRRLRPGDPRLQHNLEYVRRRAELPRRGGAAGGLVALVVGWSPLLLFGIGMLAMCAGGLGAAVWDGPRRGGAWQEPAMRGLIGAGVLLVAVALATSYMQAQERRAVVVDKEAMLRSAPTDTAPADTTLRSGMLVTHGAERKAWTRVQMRGRTGGWIPSGALAEI
ncbi:hypothetical protein GGP50_002069 [Salinibacter ruber]|uniref:SH3 domain-containing protein n=1 Tax=Salinibacter ruber TaxID=146919 RepID=UPI00216A7F08|nr:SH3 domain-containing protein [Salinibacter ruber]MCS4193846.1 hypothetical protein [Salinibacter ruber]